MALGAAVDRTRALFLAGRPLCGAVAGRLRHELRATWLGGMRVLSRIERADFDVVARRPRLGPTDLPWLAWKLATWAAPSPRGARQETLRLARRSHMLVDPGRSLARP